MTLGRLAQLFLNAPTNALRDPQMDDKTLIALIAAGAAIVGSFVPTAANLWIAFLNKKYEARKSVTDLQRELYSTGLTQNPYRTLHFRCLRLSA